MIKEIGHATLQITIVDEIEAIVDIDIRYIKEMTALNVCWILAENIDKFVDELNTVIDKYRI